jgi:hypothetical protein
MNENVEGKSLRKRGTYFANFLHVNVGKNVILSSTRNINSKNCDVLYATDVYLFCKRVLHNW